MDTQPDMTTSSDTDAPRTGTPDEHSARPVRAIRRLVHVRRAFGQPVERDGVTIVPVARVIGGTGFGSGGGTIDEAGSEPSRSGSGGGGGVGVRVTPIGVYVVTGGDVRWEPAFDLTRVVIGGQAVGAIALLVLGRALRRRRR